MPGKPTLQDLLEVQRYFDLPSPALVEKDWYVVRALAAVTAIDAAPFQFVFGGGTALSRAYGLTQRMSEDIDLKIVSEQEPSQADLRTLRDKVTKALLEAGFVFEPANRAHRDSGNGSRYTVYQLPYPTETRGDGTLRAEIKIETAVWPLRQKAVTCKVTSFLAEAFKEPPEIPAIACACVTETLAEKYVALTRRAGEQAANAERERDTTLVRHIYDLHVTRGSYDTLELVDLVAKIVYADAQAYGHKFPAYRNDPIGETLKSSAILAGDARYAADYSEFLRDMVYGERPDFKVALKTIEEICHRLTVFA